MDFLSVLAQLNDLPDTFKRQGPPYTQLMDSIAAALSLYTVGSDATFNQVAAFNNAVDGWLDVWGLLFDVPRNPNEADAIYRTRVQRIVLAQVGTLPAIQAWLNFYAPGGTVIENPNGFGYILSFPGTVTLAQIQQFLNSFNRIRPVGVPFGVTQAGLGVYLGTVEYLGDGRVSGNYLSILAQNVSVLLNASTGNATPLLPTLLVQDATILAGG
jgi:hypothetical protein